MKKQWIGYAFWLIMAGMLYFFENNTGTRIILIASLLFPLFPFLRSLFFSPDRKAEESPPDPQTVRVFKSEETEDPGDLRPYLPGDPVQRIHWKLSAKRGELLIRETDRGTEKHDVRDPLQRERVQNSQPTEETVSSTLQDVLHAARKRFLPRDHFRLRALWIVAALMVICLLLLFLLPEARRGLMALCNRLFAVSEARNNYAYQYFSVSPDQSTAPAVCLLILLAASLAVLALLLRSRVFVLGIMAVLTLFLCYFGLALPLWLCVPLYAGFAALLMRRPVSVRGLAVFVASCLAVSLLILLVFPGVDTTLENVSEQVRDRLSRMAESLSRDLWESPEEETETRHVHTRSLTEGEQDAAPEKSFRLITREEQQISAPHWVDVLKIILLLLLTAALVILPFLPFLWLNAQKRKARALRGVFESSNISEAVSAIFTRIISWLEATGNGGGNRLYRDWPQSLPDTLPEGYASRFSRCAADYEEAVYSFHPLPEEARHRAMSLLKETEETLWKWADWKLRLRLKWRLCLWE